MTALVWQIIMYTRIAALHVYHVYNLYLELMIQSRVCLHNYNSARPLIFRHNLCNQHTIACLFFFLEIPIHFYNIFFFVRYETQEKADFCRQIPICIDPIISCFTEVLSKDCLLKAHLGYSKPTSIHQVTVKKVNGDMFGSLSGYNFEKLFPF